MRARAVAQRGCASRPRSRDGGSRCLRNRGSTAAIAIGTRELSVACGARRACSAGMQTRRSLRHQAVRRAVVRTIAIFRCRGWRPAPCRRARPLRLPLQSGHRRGPSLTRIAHGCAAAFRSPTADDPFGGRRRRSAFWPRHRRHRRGRMARGRPNHHQQARAVPRQKCSCGAARAPNSVRATPRQAASSSCP